MQDVRRAVAWWAILLCAACSDGSIRGSEEPTAATVSDPSESPVTYDRLEVLLRGLPAERSLVAADRLAAVHYIVERLGDSGLAATRKPFHWDGAPDVPLVNLELRISGPEVDAPLLILGAHWDTVPGAGGADDNGSGTVALLELARRLGHREWPIELRFVWFDAEEAGLIGSGAYVRDMGDADRERCLGAINLDTIAYTDRRPGSQQLPPFVPAVFQPGDRGDFLLVVGTLPSLGLASLVTEALRVEQDGQFRVESFSLLPAGGWLVPDSRRSDHARFWDAGMPAVLITDTANGRSPHYHRRSDTLETLDLQFLQSAVRGLERAVASIAKRVEIPVGR